MPRLTIPGQHIVGDAGHTTDHDTTYTLLGNAIPPYQFFVNDPFFGAKGDGVTIENAVNITSGLNILTRTDGGSWTAGDVGKYIVVNYAGSSAVIPLSTTINGFTNSSTVTLTANAAHTVTGGDAVYGTNDTAAIQAAINAAVAYASALAGNCYAEVVFGQAIYMIGSATTKVASPIFSNSQLNFSSVIAVAQQKITLVLRGANNSPFAHWNQSVPQAPAGTILFSTLMGQTTDGTYGDPSVIGGPNPTQGYGGGSLVFNNMMPVVINLTVMCPANPSVIAFDFRGMAEAWLPNASAATFQTPAEMAATLPSNSGGVGLYMPAQGNNDRCDVGSYGCEGFYYGIGVSEHFTAQRLGIIYSNTAIFCANVGAGGAHHGAAILYASVEQCTTIVACTGGGGFFPLFIGQLETEYVTGSFVSDSSNQLCGHIGWGGLSGDTFTVTGAHNLEIISNNQVRGHVTPPSVPGSTTPITNSFWRHAAVTIATGGAVTVSAVTIDGTATGATLAVSSSTTVIVPSGETIALTYAGGTPTWTWTLM